MTKFENKTTGYVVMPLATGKFAVVAPDGTVVSEDHATMDAALAHSGVLNAELDTAELRKTRRSADTESNGPRF